MATRTISNTGGNYNATASWVEGIVPTSADDVVATATSGQLTVNVSSAASTFNFTNYTNTLTMNALWTISGTGTQTFVNTMTISGSSNISLTGTGATIVGSSAFIPNLSITGNKTLNSTLNVVNLTSSSTVTWTGTGTINVSGSFVGSTILSNIGSGITFNLIGTGNFTGLLGFKEININTSGTITLVSSSGVSIGIAANTNSITHTFNYITGTITGTKNLQISAGVITNAFWAINSSSIIWDTVVIRTAGGTTANPVITLNSDLNFIDLVITNDNSAASSPHLINGVGKLNGGRLIMNTGTIKPATTNWLGVPMIIKLGSTSSHVLTELYSSSNPTTPNIIQSQTASTTAYLGVTSTQSISNTDFTDINATAGPISVFRGTLTRTTGITNYTSYTGGSASTGGSWTFIN